MNKQVLILSLLLASSLSLAGQGKVTQVRSLPLLELSTDARSAALGGSHFGEAPSSSLFTNPTTLLQQAGSFQANVSGRFFGKYEGLDGSLFLQQTSLGYRFGQHALLAGFRYLGGLKYPVVSATENEGGQLSSYDYTLDLGYTLRLGHLSAYATASYVYSKLADRTASTAVFGVGAFYRSYLTERPAQGFSYLFGVQGTNLGPGFKYRDKTRRQLYPPIAVGAGGEVSYGLTSGHRLSLTSGADVYTFPTSSSSVAIHVGGEYSFRGLLAARAGYQHDTNGLAGWSAGLGVDLEGIRVDGAYVASTTDGVNSSFLLTLGVSL